MLAPERLRKCVEKYKIVKSLMDLAKRYGVNIKTVAKWRKRDFVHDGPMGQKFIQKVRLSLRRLLLWLSEYLHNCIWMIVYIHCRHKYPI